MTCRPLATDVLQMLSLVEIITCTALINTTLVLVYIAQNKIGGANMSTHSVHESLLIKSLLLVTVRATLFKLDEV